ncbi:response regulator [Paracidovorax konjaci]|uniref:DNA-binding response regulator, OmpR family, contains REC and winged-helix (WHTH) domain n=1 Tax=Paracidovorax konjaci TaxID=32040 RepID=A0A1I1UKH4_9BURK|nr:response regulator [Paracidovorax konjaci]SFD71326.1 DNA-binding response regulator, OmpR family, contains REC and winged-helix (wHTH) domain [Paracidovorax konjaci]
MTGKKVLVVEDDADCASILDAYLRKDGFAIAIAGDGEQALELFRQWRPDLVLLDMMLPRLSGIDVLSAIRRAGDTPVIMVTAIGDEPEKLGALRYGADDYVVKPYSAREVVARVHAVLRRAAPARTAEGPLRHGPLTVDMTAVRAAIADTGGGPDTVLDLTPTEFNLLALLLRTPFKAFTRSELLESCLPESEALERVVDTHIHNLRRKLEQHGITGVLVTVRAIGYRFQ